MDNAEGIHEWARRESEFSVLDQYYTTDQDKNWESYLSQTGGSSADPYPEDCPHCLNRGGILAQCGISPASSAGGVDRNYDTPKNVNNEPQFSPPGTNDVRSSRS